MGGEYNPMFLKSTQGLVLNVLRLSGNRLAEQSPPGTPDAPGEGFELLSDPKDAGENA